MYSEHLDLVTKMMVARSTPSLEVAVKKLIQGVSTETNYATDQKMKELLFIGGKGKSRSKLRDETITEIITPRDLYDDEVYVRSIIGLINRYFEQINLDKSRNKVLAIIVKLFACNVGGFYSGLELTPMYREIVEGVIHKLIRAESRLVTLFQLVIESQEYLGELESRFEYTSPKVLETYEQYLTDDFEVRNLNEVSIEAFLDNMEEIVDIDVAEATIESIPEIIESFGYRNFLRARTDFVMAQKFGRILQIDEEVYNKLYKIVSGFRHVYLQLTGQVDLLVYQKLFGIAGSTYKDNKNKVVKEIVKIADQEEFTKFKELLLE